MGNEKSLPDHRCNSHVSSSSSSSATSSSRYSQQNLSRTQSSPANNTTTTSSKTTSASRYTSAAHKNPTSRYENPILKRHSSPATGNSASDAQSYSSSRPASRAAKSCASSSVYSSAATVSTRLSQTKPASTQSRRVDTNRAPESKQTKYLKEQLYIKSYLDIVEQDRQARKQFKPAKPGIRNYTPKILGATPAQALAKSQEVDVWI